MDDVSINISKINLRNVISIFYATILMVSCSKAQVFNNLIPSCRFYNTSNVKNIQPISIDSVYDAFGVLDSIRPNKMCYWFRRGTSHTSGGNPYYREYNVQANYWYPAVAITPTVADSLDCRDISGGRMDNDSVVIFYSRQHTGGVTGTRDIYIQKGDKFNHFSTPALFDWTGKIKLQGGFFYGQMVAGDNAGEYYMALYQSNIDTGSTRFLITCIKTTDYWNHSTQVGIIQDGTTQYSETCLSYHGSGKMIALARNNQSGSLTPFESTNTGVSWIRRNVVDSLYWYLSGASEMANILVHDGMFDVIYECRDANMIHICKNNTINAQTFGTSFPIYKRTEIYAYNFGAGGNPSLGYPTIKRMGDIYLIVYAKQFNNNRANLYWSRDNLITDPNGIPTTAPACSTSTVTTTSFRVDITNYTEAMLQNIRYFEQDLSTDPAFGSFVTAKWRAPSSFPTGVIHNIPLVGLYDVYNSLTTATTYYLRIRACNNAGCSAYTTVNVTTL